VKTGTSLVNSLSLSLYVSLSVQISVAQKLLHNHHVFQSFETRLLDPMATPRRLFFLHSVSSLFACFEVEMNTISDTEVAF
jgi:hypothetical protein